MHSSIYWFIENATTCMIIFHIGIYAVIFQLTCHGRQTGGGEGVAAPPEFWRGWEGVEPP